MGIFRKFLENRLRSELGDFSHDPVQGKAARDIDAEVGGLDKAELDDWYLPKIKKLAESILDIIGGKVPVEVWHRLGTLVYNVKLDSNDVGLYYDEIVIPLLNDMASLLDKSSENNLPNSDKEKVKPLWNELVGLLKNLRKGLNPNRGQPNLYSRHGVNLQITKVKKNLQQAFVRVFQQLEPEEAMDALVRVSRDYQYNFQNILSENDVEALLFYFSDYSSAITKENLQAAQHLLPQELQPYIKTYLNT